MPVSYRIEARLDTTAQKIYGSETLEFMNPTDRVLYSICFHLYPNAFSDTNTVFCRENESVRSDVASGNISRLDVSELTANGRIVESARIRLEGTLMCIDVPDGIAPGRTARVEMTFELLIPRARIRFGHNGKGNYLLSHWYPIMCGYQKGELIDREYHANSEFFSNFGSYDVSLALPSDFEVGSTGKIDLIERSDTLSVWRAVADTVIDFAFACGRNFKKTKVSESGIGINYLLSEANEDYFEQVDEMTRFSLTWCSENLFPYPYEEYTVVDFAPGASGLELPGLIAVSLPGLTDDPQFSRVAGTIAHETAHQWFYATVANNEIDDPWLDEGLVSYLTGKILKAKAVPPSRFSFPGYEIKQDDISRIFTLSKEISYPIDLASYEFPDWYEYRSAVYPRAGMTLQCLETAVGDSAFAGALQYYAREYRFRHPDTDDFENAISAYAGIDLSEFYSQFISGTAQVDYGVVSMIYDKIGDDDQNYLVNVIVRRFQDGILPQTVSIVLDNGAIIDTTWDGRSRVASFEFETDSRPLYASIDQYFTYLLDRNISNNRLYRESYSSRIISFDWDAVFITELLLSLLL
jgi:hypothetical protein